MFMVFLYQDISTILVSRLSDCLTFKKNSIFVCHYLIKIITFAK